MTLTTRTSRLALIALVLLHQACKKDTDNGPSSGGGGTGPGPGPGGNGLVTSWSPTKPYPDDVITFTGGPFNTAPAQNTVTSNGQTFDILSVSATQLVVQPPAGWAPFTGGYSAVYVNSGTAADTIPYLYWKRPFNLMHFEDNLDQVFSGAPARAGDSVLFNLTGATPAGMSMSLNGQIISAPFAVDSGFYCTIGFRIPLNFASGTDEATVESALLSATNADGRSDTLTITFAPTPDMRLEGIELLGGGTSFSISAMNAGGQVLNFRVFGRYLHSTTPWSLSGPSPATGTLGVGGYPNEAFVVVNPVNMQPGSYTLAIPGTGISYGFTFTP